MIGMSAGRNLFLPCAVSTHEFRDVTTWAPTMIELDEFSMTDVSGRATFDEQFIKKLDQELYTCPVKRASC